MDVVTFLGPRVPLEVKKVMPLFQKLSEEIMLKVYTFVVEYFMNDLNSDPKVESSSQNEKEELLLTRYENLRVETALDRQTLSVLFTGLYYLVKSAIRTQPFTKLDALQKDMQELKLPAWLSQQLLKTIKSSQSLFETSLLNNRVRLCTLEDVKWRVDVTISTHSLSRVLKPSILMEITTSNGDIKTFEMSTEKFYELRYNTAKILKEMQDVEKLPILKLNK